MRRFVLTFEGKDHQIEVGKDLVIVDSHPFHVALEGQKVVVDGTEYSIEVDGNTAWVNGFPYPFSLHGDLKRPLSPSQSGREDLRRIDSRPPTLLTASDHIIEAVMPGKVLRVLVNEGDVIHAGDVVCILEAMKMENELHAPKTGTVQQVLVKPGQDVEAGEPLIVLQSESYAK